MTTSMNYSRRLSFWLVIIASGTFVSIVIASPIYFHSSIRDLVDRVLPNITPYLLIESHLFSADEYQMQVDRDSLAISAVDKNSIILIGDSHIKKMGDLISGLDNILNFGVGGDTSLGVLTRMQRMSESANPGWIVISVGYNDLKYRGVDEVLVNFKEIVSLAKRKWPNLCGIVVSGPLPVTVERRYTNNQLKILGMGLSELCQSMACKYFDPMPLFWEKDHLVSGLYEDEVHLNDDGYWRWFTALRKQIWGGN